MLDNRTVLAKTDSGRDAIANRTHNLNPRQRALLISINGETDVANLIGRFGGSTPEAATTLITALIDQGLVAPLNGVDATTAAAAPTGRDRRNGSAETASDTTIDLQRTPEETRSGLVAGYRPEPALPGEPDITAIRTASRRMTGIAWREMQQRASDSLHAAMGADADLLAMRLMRSRSESEFFDHMERAFDLIRSARGEAAALAFHHAVSGQD